MTMREDILEEARQIITQDRNADYGDPEQNFVLIARLWTEFLKEDYRFTSHEVAVLLMLVKVARITTSPEKKDHWVDIAGYAACGGELAIR